MILAIDPGLTTGLAWLSGIHLIGRPIFGFTEIEGRFHLYEWLHEVEGGTDEVVIEDWTVRTDTSKKSQQVDPWRIIGHVEGWCWERAIPFSTQMPGQAKSFGTDDKLRRLGWEATTKGGHARDAARHLLTYLVRRYPGAGQIGATLAEQILA